MYVPLLLLHFIVALKLIFLMLSGVNDSIQKRGTHATALLRGILHILYFCHLMVFVFFTLCPPSNRIYTLKHWQMIW